MVKNSHLHNLLLVVAIALYLTQVLWNTSPKLLVVLVEEVEGVPTVQGVGAMVGDQQQLTQSRKKVKEDSLLMIPEPTSTLDGAMTVVL